MRTIQFWNAPLQSNVNLGAQVSAQKDEIVLELHQPDVLYDLYNPVWYTVLLDFNVSILQYNMKWNSDM